MTRGLILIAGLIISFHIAPPAAAQSEGGPSRIEIVEVRNLGISAANDAKSVIQVEWAARLPPEATVKSFDVSLEVRYADRTSEKIKSTVSASTASARFEVPTIHLSPGRPGAEMRSFEASVTANFSETATKRGSL
jgi:hypothetical protein